MKNLLIIAALSLAAFFYFRSCHKSDEVEQLKAKDKVITKQITTEAKILSQTRLPDSILHAKIYAKAAENVVQSAAASYVPLLDSTAQKLQIQAKQIQELTVINQRLKADNLRSRRLLDTLGRVIYRYKDKYVTLAFKPDTVEAQPGGVFDFAYDADISVVQYQKRNWFLGQKKSYIDISSNDPRTTIMGVQRMVVEQDVPNFGLRLQAASSINTQNGRTFIGPAARVDLGRFSLQYSRMYNVDRNAKVPFRSLVSANYDILRF